MTKVLFENQRKSFLFFKEHISTIWNHKKYYWSTHLRKIKAMIIISKPHQICLKAGRCNNLQKCENLLFSDARFQFCAKTRSGSIICTFWWISVGPLPSQNLFCLKTWKNEYSELPKVSENSQGRICSIVCKCKFQLPASDVTLWETNQI